MYRIIGKLSAGLAFVVLLAGAANAGKLGHEFKVNTYAEGTQDYPASTGLANGSAVVVWQSDDQDGSYEGIYAQRFTRRGNKAGREFRVNTHTEYGQRHPKIAALKTGGFVVGWTSNRQDGSYDGAYAQVFDAKGNRVGPEFRVNKHTKGSQRILSVAASKNRILLIWETPNKKNSNYICRGRLFSGKGKGKSRRFIITNSHGEYCVASGIGKGKFVLVWTDRIGDGSFSDIYFQIIDSEGNKVGRKKRVHPKGLFDRSSPAVTKLRKGGFAVTWISDTEKTSADVFAQRINADGKKLGQSFVFQDSKSRSASPSIAALADGGYVILWLSYGDVYGQRFDKAGERVGDVFRANTYENSVSMDEPSVAALRNNRFLTTWASTHQDDSYRSIFGQRFD